MNRKDCENIAWILHKLSTSDVDLEEFAGEMMSLDARIREDFKMFGDGFEKDNLIKDRADKLMTEELGTSWAISRKCRETYKVVFARAKKEIETENPYL